MFEFQDNKSLDLGYSMYRLVNKKQLNQRVNDDESIDNSDIYEAIEQIEEQISVAWFHKMNQFVKKYHFHSYLISLACIYPTMIEEKLIIHLQKLSPEQFFINYNVYVLNNLDYKNENKIKECIEVLNSNNITKEAPSLTVVKYIKKHSTELKDDLCEFLNYYIPIYLKSKKKIKSRVESALQIYQKAYPDLAHFLESYPIIDSEFLKVDDIFIGHVSGFLDMGLFLMMREDKNNLIMGSSLTYVLSDSFKEKIQQQFFKCFSDSTKLKILECFKADKLCAMDLVERLGITKSTVSHHISQLLSAQIIYLSEKEGKKMYYSVNTTHMEKVFTDMVNHFK